MPITLAMSLASMSRGCSEIENLFIHRTNGKYLLLLNVIKMFLPHHHLSQWSSIYFLKFLMLPRTEIKYGKNYNTFITEDSYKKRLRKTFKGIVFDGVVCTLIISTGNIIHNN